MRYVVPLRQERERWIERLPLESSHTDLPTATWDQQYIRYSDLCRTVLASRNSSSVPSSLRREGDHQGTPLPGPEMLSPDLPFFLLSSIKEMVAECMGHVSYSFVRLDSFVNSTSLSW